MAEKDWYGPFGNWTLRGVIAVGTALGGLLFTMMGLLGYDTGKRSWKIGVPEETRWMGHILWNEVAVGLGFIALAFVQFRRRTFEIFERKK